MLMKKNNVALVGPQSFDIAYFVSQCVQLQDSFFL